MSGLTLYTYFRSSSAYRVRIALALKGLTFEPRYIHLLREGGENWQPEYLALNPQGLVPTLLDGQRSLTQSLAILEYLEEVWPDPPLLPANARDRAYVRSLAQIIACDTQPLNNLRVLGYLRQTLDVDEIKKQDWYCHWIAEGLGAVEALLDKHSLAGRCCYVDTPTFADICLIPQVYNAIRYKCDLAAYPTVEKIYKNCNSLAAFKTAAPDNQGDAE
ncbi:MAG: maleylacetoacetate isomerase [Candidatus Thiodiazotropha sp. (ex Monitilora ramsayi)]|nr:maleylacetoacetate isomerase [Candidatus Thiodiazotropha sp. (ex Monitilora ramsayi)]